jgi:hypothetical protein
VWHPSRVLPLPQTQAAFLPSFPSTSIPSCPRHWAKLGRGKGAKTGPCPDGAHPLWEVAYQQGSAIRAATGTQLVELKPFLGVCLQSWVLNDTDQVKQLPDLKRVNLFTLKHWPSLLGLWPFVSFLWSNAYSDPLPTFNWFVCFLILNCKSYLNILDTLIKYMICKYFIPFSGSEYLFIPSESDVICICYLLKFHRWLKFFW